MESDQIQKSAFPAFKNLKLKILSLQVLLCGCRSSSVTYRWSGRHLPITSPMLTLTDTNAEVGPQMRRVML